VFYSVAPADMQKNYAIKLTVRHFFTLLLAKCWRAGVFLLSSPKKQKSDVA